MAYLFINYSDGLYICSKKIRIEEDEENKIKNILVNAGLRAEEVELRDDNVISYSIEGFTWYLNNRDMLAPINKEIDDVLLENPERKQRFDEFHKPKY